MLLTPNNLVFDEKLLPKHSILLKRVVSGVVGVRSGAVGVPTGAVGVPTVPLTKGTVSIAKKCDLVQGNRTPIAYKNVTKAKQNKSIINPARPRQKSNLKQVEKNPTL